jgi:hypothetical protein
MLKGAKDVNEAGVKMLDEQAESGKLSQAEMPCCPRSTRPRSSALAKSPG